ncbi:PIN domain-containing protein [Leptospira sp. 'Mane']|uniref:PIN domain-containing protein n=1 Tax=Leptospira sp. 'Mane' TaxID=3387407 RepID=UPI00398AD852
MYVFDTNVLIDLFSHYYPSRFPTLWNNFEQLKKSNQIVSVKEVLQEIDQYIGKTNLTDWAKANKDIFHAPTQQEVEFVKKIFSIPHFQQNISAKTILTGKPAADPFVIAKATTNKNGIVITNEANKANSARIPNICEKFEVRYMNLEQWMESLNWRF